ncbi:TPA: hypothetical protein QDZ95_003218 [Shewanella algae]|uniref:hypothetical protein n=1 Tax=Shewanella algae TaxID=38313 RepID=UPI001C55D35B|nr:hypothetical protein [Shewanella algae]HDS1199675.1 hypothetical protein [Shewanella algae]
MSDIDNLASQLVECGFIVFDGASGSGKTYVASRVASLLEKSHLDFDSYIDSSSNEPYVNRINYDALRTEIEINKQSVVLSGVLAKEVLRYLGYQNYTLVYVANVIPGTSTYRYQEFCDEDFLQEITPESTYQEVLNGGYLDAQEVIDQMVRVYHKNETPKNDAEIIFHNHIE